MAEATLHPAETPAARPWYRRRLWLWPLLLICLLVVYYVGGMLWLHTIDDDPDFGLQSSAPEGGSHAVAVAADLIDREINIHRWVANDPFFLPGSLLDNMPDFQQGIVAAISRFTLELRDQIGRMRGTEPGRCGSGSGHGPAQLSRHHLDVRLSHLVGAHRQLRAAVPPGGRGAAQLQPAPQPGPGGVRDPGRQPARHPRPDRRRPRLLLGRADHQIRAAGFWPDFAADDLFYATKGRLYAYYLLLRALAGRLRQRHPRARAGQRLVADRWTASARPRRFSPGWSSTARPTAQFMPSHLAAQGFFLLRARTQLREITNILLK